MSRRMLIALLLIPAVSSAQTEFGIKGGLNISDVVMTNYINPDVEGHLNLKLGAHGGFFASTVLADRIGVSAELLYSNKGVKGLSDINLHYITLPLLMQYQLTERIFAEFGPEPAYLFSAVSKHGDVSSTYNNRFDLSLDGGFGFEAGKLIFGIRYCVGVFSVRDPIEQAGFPGIERIKYQNRVLQVSVSYKCFALE